MKSEPLLDVMIGGMVVVDPIPFQRMVPVPIPTESESYTTTLLPNIKLTSFIKTETVEVAIGVIFQLHDAPLRINWFAPLPSLRIIVGPIKTFGFRKLPQLYCGTLAKYVSRNLAVEMPLDLVVKTTNACPLSEYIQFNGRCALLHPS